MTNENATPDYIKIEDLPFYGLGTRWPWDKWAKIPEGMALEIDCNGRPARNVCASVASCLRHKERGLTVMQRSGRVFIFRPKAEAPQEREEES